MTKIEHNNHRLDKLIRMDEEDYQYFFDMTFEQFLEFSDLIPLPVPIEEDESKFFTRIVTAVNEKLIFHFLHSIKPQRERYEFLRSYFEDQSFQAFMISFHEKEAYDNLIPDDQSSIFMLPKQNN